MTTTTCLKCNQPNEDPRILCRECNAELPLLREGQKIFFYEVGKHLFQDRVSTSFRAEDTFRGGRCIIREIIAPADAAEVRQRFTEAAQPLKDLGSPHVPRLQVTTKEAHCFVIEYVEGNTLAEDLRERGRLAEDEALVFLDELLNALEGLHGRSVFHGDLAPRNIMWQKSEGKLILLNFAALRDATQLIRGDMEYAPPYAPEERRTGKLSAASDVYTAGLTALCLVTGKDPGDACDSYLDAQSKRWNLSGAPVSDHLRSVLERMMQPSPTDRLQNVAEVRAALKAQPPTRDGETEGREDKETISPSLPLPLAPSPPPPLAPSAVEPKAEELRACSNPRCRGRLTKRETRCPDCGTDFEEGWIARWLRETVRPALESDFVETLNKKARLFDPMREVGLSPVKLEEALASEIKRLVGTTEGEVTTWLTAYVQPALQTLRATPKRVISRTERTGLLQAASVLGVDARHGERILDQEMAKYGVQIERPTLYCPVPECACSFAYQDLTRCPQTGEPLVEPTVRMWSHKFVQPGLRNDVLATLEASDKLLARAREIGLSEAEAKRALADEFARITGVTDDELRDWIEAFIRPALRQEVLADEDRSRVLMEAEQLGIRRVAADEIIGRILPKLGIDDVKLDFGELEPNTRRSLSLTVKNLGGGKLAGRILTSVSWLNITPARLDPDKREQTLQIHLDTAGLPQGWRDAGSITFQTTGGVRTIPVSVAIVAPRPERTVAPPAAPAPVVTKPLEPERPVVKEVEPPVVVPPPEPEAAPVAEVAPPVVPPPPVAERAVAVAAKPARKGKGVIFGTLGALVVISGVVWFVFLRGGRNEIPVVQAVEASATSVQAGETVTLTGRASDPNGDTLSYIWKPSVGQIEGSGPSVKLNTANIPASPDPIPVTVDLTVDDGKGGVAAGKTTITVNPTPVTTPTIPEPAPTLSPREQAQAFLRRAQQLFEQRQYDAAIREAERGLVLDRGNTALRDIRDRAQGTKRVLAEPQIRAALQRANQLFGQLQYDAALQACDEGLRLDPNNQDLRNLRSRIQETKRLTGR